MTTPKPVSRVFPTRQRAPIYPAAILDADILVALAREDLPLGAYDLAHHLSEQGRQVTVVAIYRALERLCAGGQVERVETLARYRIRDIQHALLLTCIQCGKTISVDATAQHAALQTLLAARNFVADKFVLEAKGRCQACTEPGR